jgi:uncharacterized membrane protein YphA (DoxX/SURF4 family)
MIGSQGAAYIHLIPARGENENDGSWEVLSNRRYPGLILRTADFCWITEYCLPVWLFLPGLIIEFMGIIILVAGIVTGSVAGILAGIFLIGAAVAVHLFQVTKKIRTSRDAMERDTSGPSPEPALSGDAKILYADKLITITGNAILFQNYSLTMKPRRVPFTDVDHIDVLEPALTTGKWRLWGSGNFTMWFPLDASRSSRDTIFHAYLKTRGMNIGFTVERSREVILLLRAQGLIGTDERSDF